MTRTLCQTSVKTRSAKHIFIIVYATTEHEDYSVNLQQNTTEVRAHPKSKPGRRPDIFTDSPTIVSNGFHKSRISEPTISTMCECWRDHVSPFPNSAGFPSFFPNPSVLCGAMLCFFVLQADARDAAPHAELASRHATTHDLQRAQHDLLSHAEARRR